MDDILLRALDLSERLVAARATHRAAEHTLVLLLTELGTDQLFRPFGYRSIEEFAAVKLDLTARQTRDLVRIGRALPGLPLLDAAMKAGALDWTKVRELARIATPETEAEWIARAKSVSSRVLEREVAAAAPGACPSDEGVRAEPLRALHVRGESPDIETIRAALSAFRARTAATIEEIEDCAALAAICRRYLADLDEDGDRPPTARRSATRSSWNTAPIAATPTYPMRTSRRRSWRRRRATPRSSRCAPGRSRATCHGPSPRRYGRSCSRAPSGAARCRVARTAFGWTSTMSTRGWTVGTMTQAISYACVTGTIARAILGTSTWIVRETARSSSPEPTARRPAGGACAPTWVEHIRPGRR